MYKGLEMPMHSLAQNCPKLEEIKKELKEKNEFDNKGDKPFSNTQIRGIEFTHYMEQDIPEPKLLLEPWLHEGTAAMLYSKRGIGKTFFCLSIAYAIATGGDVAGWKAPEARRVLYIDGEMDSYTMQKRLKQIHGTTEGVTPLLRVITPDLVDGPMADLASSSAQDAYADEVKWADLIIVDNIATLCRSGAESSTKEWGHVQRWVLALRRQGKSILLVHHASRSGSSRGLISKEDITATNILLTRPKNYRFEQGARFNVEFDKGRSVVGVDAASFEVILDVELGGARWIRTEPAESRLARVCKLLQEGKNQSQIADLLGVHRSTICRDVTAMNEGGVYPEVSEEPASIAEDSVVLPNDGQDGIIQPQDKEVDISTSYEQEKEMTTFTDITETELSDQEMEEIQPESSLNTC